MAEAEAVDSPPEEVAIPPEAVAEVDEEDSKLIELYNMLILYHL